MEPELKAEPAQVNTSASILGLTAIFFVSRFAVVSGIVGVGVYHQMESMTPPLDKVAVGTLFLMAFSGFQIPQASAFALGVFLTACRLRPSARVGYNMAFALGLASPVAAYLGFVGLSGKKLEFVPLYLLHLPFGCLVDTLMALGVGLLLGKMESLRRPRLKSESQTAIANEGAAKT